MIIGLVGKPSVGKSTFFRAATLAEAEIAPYPFTTIKPNTGMGYVKVKCADKDFNRQCNPREGFCMVGWRFVPVQIIDVAGLVPGAHEGKGMGNQFLDDLRQADVLVHVVDISGSANEKGEQIEKGSYDPAKDIEFLENELDQWYLAILKKPWEKFARQAEQEHLEIYRAVARQFSGLGGVNEDVVKAVLEALNLKGKQLREWTENDLHGFAHEIRRRTKPTITACNKIDVEGGHGNFLRIKKTFPQHIFMPCSAESELALREAAKHEFIKYIPGEKSYEITNKSRLNEKQLSALQFIKNNMLEKYGGTGVQDVLDTAVFWLLKYIAVFPGGVNKLEDKHGNVLPDCFLLPKGSTPLDFAFRIHTDIGKKYVKAINVKTRLPLAKDHLLENRDVVEIKTS